MSVFSCCRSWTNQDLSGNQAKGTFKNGRPMLGCSVADDVLGKRDKIAPLLEAIAAYLRIRGDEGDFANLSMWQVAYFCWLF
ncbi:hypothetical protein QYF36_002413 [Acer negundo]|nr:hypothetical protein QYF36_002413 [Acer negundo]